MTAPTTTAPAVAADLSADRGSRLGLLHGTLLALVLWSIGFRAITEDHFQYLIPVRRAADPDFAVGDWFTDETTTYHYTFQTLAGLAERVGLLTAALVVSHLLIVAVLLVGLARLVDGVGASVMALPLVVFVLRFGVQRTWGDVNLVGVTALPHYAAMACALLTIAFLFRGRYRGGLALLVVTTYLHVSVGAWTIVVALVIVAADVIGGQVRWRELAPSAALSATALIPLALAARSGFTGADVDARVFEILFFNRSPHHYSFTAFNTGRQLDMVVVASVALVSEHLLRLERRSLRLVILTILGLGLMSAFFLHVVYWPLPVRLFPYRLSPLLTALAAVLAIALAVRPDLPRAHRIVGLLGVGALVLSGDRDALLNGVNDAVVATLMISTGIAALLVVARQYYRAPAADLSWSISLLAVIATTLTVGFLVSSPPAHTTDWLTAKQRDVVELIGQVVPSGETILTPPGEAYIRYSTARAIVVDFKAFPMAGDEMVEWRQRLEDVTGRSIRTDGAGGEHLLRELTAAYRQRSRTDLETVARHYDASYLLVAADSVAGRRIADDGTAAMWEAGGFTLARIDPS